MTNEGNSAGQTTCRVTDPADRNGGRGGARPQPADRARPDGDVHQAPRPSSAPTVRAARRSSAARRDGDAPGRGRARTFATSSPSRSTRRPGRRVLMDRYERLEQIDYKSARDVVTEADHLSEALIVERDPGALPGGRDPGRGDRRAPRGRRRGAHLGPWPGLDRRPARRDRELRQRHPGLLRLDRRWSSTASRRSASSSTRRATSRSAATADGPATLDGRPIRASVKDKAVRLRDLDGAQRPVGRRPRSRNVRKAIRIPRSMGSAALALAYVANGRFDAFIQQGGLSAWDVAAAGLIAERGGARVTAMDGGPWFDLAHSPRSIGILAAPPAHHEALLGARPLTDRAARSVLAPAVRPARPAGPGPIPRRTPPIPPAAAPSQRSSSGSCWRIWTPSSAVRRRARSR